MNAMKSLSAVYVATRTGALAADSVFMALSTYRNTGKRPLSGKLGTNTAITSHWTVKMRIALYLPALSPRCRSGRLLLTCRPGSCSSRQSPPAAADRCSGRAGSGRSPPGTGTPQWLSSGGASSHLRSSPPSPARTEDAAEQRKKSLSAWFFLF